MLLWVRMLRIETRKVSVLACRVIEGRYACTHTQIVIAGKRPERLCLKSSRVEWAEVVWLFVT